MEITIRNCWLKKFESSNAFMALYHRVQNSSQLFFTEPWAYAQGITSEKEKNYEGCVKNGKKESKKSC
ncbi:MAG: hypothetical protein AABW59_03480, partial [archaeon]